jgi:hypothetical protein
LSAGFPQTAARNFLVQNLVGYFVRPYDGAACVYLSEIGVDCRIGVALEAMLIVWSY